jgi:RNA polymerase sigma factor for flagellar operon FliA
VAEEQQNDAATSDGGVSEILRLWREFTQTRDDRRRDRLILHYIPLVHYVVSRLSIRLPVHVDSDDLYSDGLEGLIKAVDRFDHTKGMKFSTFAIPRIRGAMIDGMRTLDWVPRSVRKFEREYNAAVARLQADGREHTDDDVAAMLGISRQELDKSMLDVARASIHTLDGLLLGDEEDSSGMHDRLADANAPDPHSEAVREERYSALLRAVDSLPERERIVITHFFFEERPLKEIAALLGGVTESRVSQLQGQAAARLRQRLKSHYESTV